MKNIVGTIIIALSVSLSPSLYGMENGTAPALKGLASISPQNVAWTVGSAVALGLTSLFVSNLVHEAGHALAANHLCNKPVDLSIGRSDDSDNLDDKPRKPLLNLFEKIKIFSLNPLAGSGANIDLTETERKSVKGVLIPLAGPAMGAISSLGLCYLADRSNMFHPIVTRGLLAGLLSCHLGQLVPYSDRGLRSDGYSALWALGVSKKKLDRIAENFLVTYGLESAIAVSTAFLLLKKPFFDALAG